MGNKHSQPKMTTSRPRKTKKPPVQRKQLAKPLTQQPQHQSQSKRRQTLSQPVPVKKKDGNNNSRTKNLSGSIPVKSRTKLTQISSDNRKRTAEKSNRPPPNGNSTKRRKVGSGPEELNLTQSLTQTDIRDYFPEKGRSGEISSDCSTSISQRNSTQMHYARKLTELELKLLTKDLECKRYKDKFATLMESVKKDFCCSICGEVFLQSSVITCGHTFCKYCIDKWLHTNKSCPICRTQALSSTRQVDLTNFLDKVYESDELSAEKLQRTNLIEERSKQEQLEAERRAQPVEDPSSEENSYSGEHSYYDDSDVDLSDENDDFYLSSDEDGVSLVCRFCRRRHPISMSDDSDDSSSSWST